MIRNPSLRSAIPLLFAGAVLVLFALACGSADDSPPEKSPPTDTPTTDVAGGEVPEDVVVTVYRSSTCGCCAGYEDYLQEQGFEVDDQVMDDVESIKDDMLIPEDMRSCHTSLVGDYFVEGHVPVEAILALLNEAPAIDGIALPGMPQGSPGMSGDKTEPFVIYSITDGEVEEFMTI